MIPDCNKKLNAGVQHLKGFPDGLQSGCAVHRSSCRSASSPKETASKYPKPPECGILSTGGMMRIGAIEYIESLKNMHQVTLLTRRTSGAFSTKSAVRIMLQNI